MAILASGRQYVMVPNKLFTTEIFPISLLAHNYLHMVGVLYSGRYMIPVFSVSQLDLEIVEVVIMGCTNVK